MSFRLRINVPWPVVAALGWALVGCQKTTDSEPAELTIVDGRGDTISLTEPAQRVVSLAPSCTEIVCAVGGLQTLAAVTRFCDDPPEVLSLPRIEGFNNPGIEAILALQPDAVLASDITRPDTVARLRATGLTVVVLTGAGLDGIVTDLETTAALLGMNAAAAVEPFQQTRQSVVKALAGLSEAERPRVLVTFGELTTFSAGKGTFTDALLREAGAINLAAAAASPWPKLSREYLLEQNPAVLVVTRDDVPGVQPAPSTLLQRYRDDPVWREIEAVRRGKVYVVDSDAFTVPSPNVAQLLRALAQQLHPDRFGSN